MKDNCFCNCTFNIHGYKSYNDSAIFNCDPEGYFLFTKEEWMEESIGKIYQISAQIHKIKGNKISTPIIKVGNKQLEYLKLAKYVTLNGEKEGCIGKVGDRYDLYFDDEIKGVMITNVEENCYGIINFVGG
jgi:hypothetical protein